MLDFSLRMDYNLLNKISHCVKLRSKFCLNLSTISYPLYIKAEIK